MIARTPSIWAESLTAAAARRSAPRCPHCGQPRQIIRDETTLPVGGKRLAPCDCGEGK